MKNLLTADLKKLFKGKALYFLLGASVILPLFTTLFIALLMFITTQVGEANAFAEIFSPTVLYVTSFSLLNNIGLALLITLILVSAGDFTQATIRNKVVAGHKREHIFYSSLITNLLFAFFVMFTYSSLSYLFSSLIFGFTLNAFLIVLKFGLIGYTSYLVIYTLATVVMFKLKNAWAPILIVIGVMIGVSIINFFVGLILEMKEITFNVIPYIFPMTHVNATGEGVFQDKFDHFWIFSLVNLAYFGLLCLAGYKLSRKTDFN
ncbi:MAG: hypothetical protein WC275_03125 [Bacilli bacterium]